MKLQIIVSLIVIFVIGGIGIFVTLPNTIDFQKSDPVETYYEKNEKYDVLLWKSYTYDQNDQKLVTIHRNENYDIEYWKEFKYDQWGNLIESIKYDNEGNLKKIQKSIFDPYGDRVKTTAFDHQGNLVRIQESDFIPNFQPKVGPYMTDEMTPSSVDIFYDENRNQIKLQYISKNGTNLINYSYSYDLFNNMIEMEVLTYLGNIVQFEQREYDENGNLVTLKVIPPRFKYEFVTNYEYDKKGNKIVEKQRLLQDNDDRIIQLIIMSYDAEGNKIVEKKVKNQQIPLNMITSFGVIDNMVGEEKPKNPLLPSKTITRDDVGGNPIVGKKEINSLISLKTITYDITGNILEKKIFDSNIVITTWEKFNYDKHHNLIESKEFDKNADIISWEKFNYDKHHNLIESKEFDITKTTSIIQKSNQSDELELLPENDNDSQKSQQDTPVEYKEIIITPSLDALPPECVPECFVPNPVTINVGDTITFKNTKKTHDLLGSGHPYIGADGKFETGPLAPGDSYSITFTEEGIYKYFSFVAPWMQGVIIVGDQPLNLPPIADAGNDQTVDAGEHVTLSGTGKDSENKIMLESWHQTSGPKVRLFGSNNPGTYTNSANTSFIAPDVTSETVLTFEFTVRDDILQFDTDTMLIIIMPISNTESK